MALPIKAVDLFCGAGGTSTGLLRAGERLGRRVEITAVNHWMKATETFSLNHPEDYHRVLCTGVDDINPRDLFREGELDILWASPECTHHSVARGGRPINEQSRATAWCVVRWADALRPSVIFVENVPEFLTWGGIGANGRPLASKKGATFIAWKQALESLGYRVDWRILCAADVGTPTTRKRLFVQAVRGRRRVIWPAASHSQEAAPDLFGGRKQWVAMRDNIDWSLKGRWIDEMKPQARYGGLPLSPNSLNRINTGFFKHGLKNFIVESCHGNGAEADGNARRVHSVDDPLGTVPCSNRFALAEAFIIPQHSGNQAISVDVPAPTVTTTSRGIALVEPFIVPPEGVHRGNAPRSVDQPLQTVTAARGGGLLIEPFLIGAGGPTGSGAPQSIDKPLGTVLAQDRRALVEPFLVKLRGTSKAQIEKHSGSSLDEPAPTITAGGGHLALAEPFLFHMNHHGGDRTHSIDQPLPAVCGNRGEIAMIEAALLPQQSGGELRPVSQPCPTVATSGAIGLVEPYLVEYYGNGGSQSLDDPLNTVTTKDRHALVSPIIIVDGNRFRVRYRYRMLQPHELAAAQGFPRGYRFSGNKTEQVKQIGNAVPPQFSESLAIAQLTQDPQWWEASA